MSNADSNCETEIVDQITTVIEFEQCFVPGKAAVDKCKSAPVFQKNSESVNELKSKPLTIASAERRSVMSEVLEQERLQH
jgi:hypothetical protein